MARHDLRRRSALLGGAALLGPTLLGIGLPRPGHAQETPRRGGVLVVEF